MMGLDGGKRPRRDYTSHSSTKGLVPGLTCLTVPTGGIILFAAVSVPVTVSSVPERACWCASSADRLDLLRGCICHPPMWWLSLPCSCWSRWAAGNSQSLTGVQEQEVIGSIACLDGLPVIFNPTSREQQSVRSFNQFGSLFQRRPISYNRSSPPSPSPSFRLFPSSWIMVAGMCRLVLVRYLQQMVRRK